MQSQKIAALREWMVAKGCKIHPALTLPSNINGVQGISTNHSIPHKTLIIAVPSSLILTTIRCYNDPALHRLFKKNDDLFDYQSEEDAEFTILCVFLMYHKINIATSEWREYLETIAEPQTAIDWGFHELKGLNRSLIEEAIHVKIECNKLQQRVIQYLLKRREFKGASEQVLKDAFHYCYRAVMTRCFGYYFKQACLIPIADLINHSCQAIDHQMINVNFQSGKQMQVVYEPRKTHINCQLLNIQPPTSKDLPFREKFLVDKSIIQNSQQKLNKLDRRQIQKYLYDWNNQKLKKGQKLQNLNFCSEDEQEDNDTDEEFEVEQMRQLDHCKRNQEEQMSQFINNYVTVEKYIDVETRLEQLIPKHSFDQAKVKEEIEKSNSAKVDTILIDQPQKQQEGQIQKKQNLVDDVLQTKEQEFNSKIIINSFIGQKIKQPEPKKETQPIDKQPIAKQSKKQNPFSNKSGQGVPIQMVESSSQEQSEDEQQWGLKQGSYFTMSTSSPVAQNTEVYNSYGSRTNKFLLIWYGFTYQNNLYDSVSFRLQVQFGDLRPAKQIVLDTYIGGQGLSFKKNQQQVVKQTEVSRQFRLKRNNICQKLLIFLRLYLMNYYKGDDLYKLFVTFPASINYQIFVLQYYKDIVVSLYDRYPLQVIEQLKTDYNSPEYDEIKFKVKYKIIYLEEQRKLIDINLRAVNAILEILQKVKQEGGVMKKSMYQEQPIQTIRMIKRYLIHYQNYMPYILYKQQQNKKTIQPSKKPTKQKKKETKPEQLKQINSETGEEEQWEDVSSQQQPINQA